MLEINEIYLGDCLDIMQYIPNKSIDMILCDLPYGVTARNKWDVIIPFEHLWEQYKRVIKDNGAIVLTGQGLFTAKTMLSNEKMWRYNLVWNKVLPSGFLNANRQPLRSHEDIMVFYRKLPTYNPQKTKGKPCHSRGSNVGKSQESFSRNTNYEELVTVETIGNEKFPTSIIEISKPHPSTSVHPTQKPVALFEYLIKTYTNEGELVLDNCIGSGTTALACINTNRDFIGIEIEEKHVEIARGRIKDALAQRRNI